MLLIIERSAPPCSPDWRGSSSSTLLYFHAHFLGSVNAYALTVGLIALIRGREDKQSSEIYATIKNNFSRVVVHAFIPGAWKAGESL